MKLLASVLPFAFGGGYRGQSFANYGLFKFDITNEHVAGVVEKINEKFDLDWFRPHTGPSYNVGETVEFLTLPENRAFILRMLKDSGAENITRVNNLDSLIEKSFDGNRDGRVSGSFDLTTFHEFSEIEEWLTTTVDGDEKATVTSIGKTHEDNNIYVVDILDRNANFEGSDYPKIVVDCGIHAREWASFAFCPYLIHELLWGGKQSWTSRINWIIYPAFNPDGYIYSWTDYRYQRKNRSPNSGSNCRGTDLNRNYDIQWMNAGTSSDPCASTYGGASAFSELESQAHRDHQTPLLYKKAYLTYHAYSEVIIYPYSSSYAYEAHNKEELNTLAGEMTSKIRAVHGKSYSYGEGAPFFYPASGGSDDWSHQTGVDIVYTIELRDNGNYGFLMPESEIQPNNEENMEGIRAVYQHVKPNGSCIYCHSDAICRYDDAENKFNCTCKEGYVGNGLNFCQPIVTTTEEVVTDETTTEPPTTTSEGTTTTADPCPCTDDVNNAINNGLTPFMAKFSQIKHLATGANSIGFAMSQTIHDADLNPGMQSVYDGYLVMRKYASCDASVLEKFADPSVNWYFTDLTCVGCYTTHMGGYYKNDVSNKKKTFTLGFHFNGDLTADTNKQNSVDKYQLFVTGLQGLGVTEQQAYDCVAGAKPANMFNTDGSCDYSDCVGEKILIW